MIESIIFDTQNNILKVVLQDGVVLEYTSAAKYLADFPDRINDVKAMGWM